MDSINGTESMDFDFHDDSETPAWTRRMKHELTVGRMLFYCSNPDDWRRQK